MGVLEGDENSKFFHGIINRKRANLSVKGIMIEGEWVDDPIRVKDEFLNGSPTLEFQFHRGLKQGDPLAPFVLSYYGSIHLFFQPLLLKREFFNGIQEARSKRLRGLMAYCSRAKNIRRCQLISSFLDHVLQIFLPLIGNGLHTRFWKDHWNGDCTFQVCVSILLFALDTVKDISVACKLQSPLVSSYSLQLMLEEMGLVIEWETVVFRVKDVGIC
ncbi:hypothetical protein Tco_0539861 [Tanacetum coccineum]